MRDGGTQKNAPPDAGPENAEPVVSIPLAVTDHAGRQRRGHAVLLPGWSAEASADRPGEGEEFRIVILAQPPEGAISPAEGVVVSSPAGRLACAGKAVREPAATYSAGTPAGLDLPSADIDLLRRGSLCAATPLEITAGEVFAGGEARLELLAGDLLASLALVEQLNLVAVALNAPAAAGPADRERLTELRNLVCAVGEGGWAERSAELPEALARLSGLVSNEDREPFLACAEQTYPHKRALMEDIYMLRAFLQSPQEASELLSIQRFLQQAAVPADEADLALDHSLSMEQLTFATLAAEPQRVPPARAMLETFRRKFTSRYREHHTRYWAEMARLRARLWDEQTMVEALRRLNSIAELGPPMGAGGLAAYEELVAQTAGCPRVGDVEEALGNEALCPQCGLSLDQTPPVARAEEILRRIQHACDRQMARLSSSAVQQVLRRSNDARVEQFLRMVQASQLSSLSNLIDDELVGYLRRFLVESRIEEALQPLLNQLQRGATPDVDEARSAMREVSRVLQRAFQAAQKALPPGEPPATGRPPPRKRKR